MSNDHLFWGHQPLTHQVARNWKADIIEALRRRAVRLPCGGQAGDRLHLADGTPRTTAASTRGRELNWFHQHGPCRHPDDPENWSFDVITADHDAMKGGGNYPKQHSRVTISRSAFPSWTLAAETAGVMAVLRHGGMPIEILERY